MKHGRQLIAVLVVRRDVMGILGKHKIAVRSQKDCWENDSATKFSCNGSLGVYMTLCIHIHLL